MTKRVLGVLAALSVTVGLVGCGGTDDPVPAAKDSGADTKPTDGGADTNKPDVVVLPDGKTDTPATVADKTTGKVCTSDADCDITGNGLGRCTNKLYIISPLNPTAICIQLDTGGGDACDPGDGTKIPLCDGDTGYCSKSGTNPAICEAFCTVDDTGKVTQACAGKNACNPEALGTDSAGKATLFGTCQGGCATDADCPSGAVCDALQNFCVDKVCTTDTECSKLFSKPPPGFKCVADATGGKSHCKFSYAKNPGDKCTPAAASGSSSSDCLCFGKTGAGADQGMCISLCKTVDFGTANAECATGFTCDPLLNKTDSTGKEIYSAGFKLPAGIAGYCVKNCTADADCGIAGWKCEQSAGTAAKTCRPPA